LPSTTRTSLGTSRWRSGGTREPGREPAIGHLGLFPRYEGLGCGAIWCDFVAHAMLGGYDEVVVLLYTTYASTALTKARINCTHKDTHQLHSKHHASTALTNARINCTHKITEERTIMSRLSITFEPRAAKRLEELATDGRSKSDVIREALALEQVYRDAEAAGYSLIVRNEQSGEETRIIRT